eukprot:225810_1
MVNCKQIRIFTDQVNKGHISILNILKYLLSVYNSINDNNTTATINMLILYCLMAVAEISQSFYIQNHYIDSKKQPNTDTDNTTVHFGKIGEEIEQILQKHGIVDMEQQALNRFMSQVMMQNNNQNNVQKQSMVNNVKIECIQCINQVISNDDFMQNIMLDLNGDTANEVDRDRGGSRDSRNVNYKLLIIKAFLLIPDTNIVDKILFYLHSNS